MSAIGPLTCDNETSRRSATNTATALTHPSDYGGRRAGVSLPMNEEWRPVLGYEGFYEVSSRGRIRSVPRHGTRGGIKAGYVNDRGYVVMRLSAHGVARSVQVHALVAEAWHGPRPDGLICRHLNDVKTDNYPENLAWGTKSDNGYDAIRNGIHHLANRESCSRGHEYTPETTHWKLRFGRWSRTCRACDVVYRRNRKAKKLSLLGQDGSDTDGGERRG